MLRIFCVIAISLLLHLQAGAQAGITVHGQVTDSLSGQPPAFAAYAIKGTTRGGLCDAEGRFTVTLPALPARLIFTCLGYRRSERSVNDSAALRVQLAPSVFMLQGVTVSAQKVQVLQEDNSIAFIDFRFYDDYILALTSDRNSRKNKLLLMDVDGKNIAGLPVSSDAEAFYSDCLGAVQLITKDSVYQVYYDYERLQLLYASERETFMRTMMPCKCRIDDYYYFGYSSYHQLKLDYCYVNWYRKGEMVKFRRLQDSVTVAGFEQNYDLAYFLAKRRQRPAPEPRYCVPVSLLENKLDSFRATEPIPPSDTAWLHALSAPLVRDPAGPLIFNYADSVIERYSKNGQLLGKARMQFKGKGTWQRNEVQEDESTGRLYGFEVRNNGITTVKEIDPETGKVVAETVVDKFPFLTHRLVHDGYLYFTWKNTGEDLPRKVSRIKLN